MRFSEHELTTALTGAAKDVLAAQSKDVRKGRVTREEAWEKLGRYQRFQLLDGLGDQVLPVLVALPDVEVRTGERATYTDAQVTEVVEGLVGEEGGRVRRKVVVAARVQLVQRALAHVPPRRDPDVLEVPDHL